MTLEEQLTAVLKSVCPRVFPDMAPYSTPRPYVTWQSVGGTPQRYLDKTATNRHALVQINVWHDTRLACRAVARAIEEALCAATDFQASPASEVVAVVDDDREDRRGDRQDFEILGRI